MPNLKLTLAYDGTNFSGWQVQPERRTVQGVLERAIHDLTGESLRVFSAGRTDAGVHALGQVANFRSDASIPPEKWGPALQVRLPDDVVILESAAVDEEFHATYSARLKRYRYVIRIAQADDPFLTRYAWRMSTDLEFEAMRTAAAALLGTHDFRCFESDWPNKATSVRTIFDVSLQTLARWPGWDATPVGLREDQTGSSDSISQGTPEAEFVVFEIEGDGFLYNMVRAIVGTLVKVGRGKWDSSVMSEIIAGQDRSRAGETAPAQGLYLVSVTY